MEGKAREDFEKILKENRVYRVFEIHNYDDFDYLPLSMKYGPIVDFFDSVGMQIYVKPISGENKWSVYIDNHGHHILPEYLYAETRSEARESAINKAVEIYNENNK